MSLSPNQTEEKVQIQVGDIIEIHAPTDMNLNNKQFFVNYASSKLIKLLGDKSDEEIELPITDTGEFRNEAITGIDLLSRAESPSYALQNDLIPGKWIDIYFAGDVPTVITGKITNLEEDMIEITIIESGEVIYIDFGYKGLPLDLPIEKIIQRGKPESIENDVVEVGDAKTADAKTADAKTADAKTADAKTADVKTTDAKTADAKTADAKTADLESPEQLQEELDVMVPNMKDQIREVILQADQIRFGELLDVISQEVAVPESQQRFGIEKQTTDMLDEMLSDIPNAQRTSSVLNAIHTEIERYKQLRTEFSVFDERGNALMPSVQGADYKPLVNSLLNLDQKLFWLLPVVRETKKLYDIDTDILDANTDIEPQTLSETRIEENRIVENYNENDVPDGENNYAYLVRSLRQYLTPFSLPSQPELSLANLNVQTPITGVVNNLDDFYSSVYHDEAVKRKRFYLQNYVMGDTILESQRVLSGNIIVRPRSLTSSDVMNISSLLFLPESTFAFSRINLPSTSVMTKSDLNHHFIQYWAFLNQLTVPTTQIIDDMTTTYRTRP